MQAQFGGALAALIGVLLLLTGRSPAPTLDPQTFAYFLICVGTFLAVAGTVARSILID